LMWSLLLFVMEFCYWAKSSWHEWLISVLTFG